MPKKHKKRKTTSAKDTLTRNEQKDNFSATDKDSMQNVASISTDNITQLASTSKQLHRMFQSQVNVNALLTAVAQCNLGKVQRLPTLHALLQKGDVKDASHRQFKQVTAYQFALWSLDMRMARVIENIAEMAPGQEGVDLRAALMAQRKELEEKGLNYTLNGVNYCESFYKPELLLAACRNRDDSKTGTDFKTRLEDLKAQFRMMPMHALLEKELFRTPNPTFHETLMETHPVMSEKIYTDYDNFVISFIELFSPDAYRFGDRNFMRETLPEVEFFFDALFEVRIADLASSPDLSALDAESKSLNSPSLG